ncbi:MAG TPA: 2OG-Fe(II) oxygenase [Enhygromyxa sp.]|nr:2OG-Fe(II) oxygenase [Enhygromyxa sp.]
MPEGTIDHPSFRVVDDFLSEPEWTELWSHFQFAELLPVTRTRGAWKLDDGVPLGGEELRTPPRGTAMIHDPDDPRRYPSQTPIDHVIRALLERPEVHEGLVRDGWDRISARAYVYPRETGLSWHVDDHELYAGAFIYYAHPIWNAHWGGELLIAELDPDADEELPIMGYRFETEAYSERLLEMGCGSFIMPRPNRLVILAGAPHMIARVSPAAGHNVRASVTGFFLAPDRG